MNDQNVHEIQLSGKQLLFGFMSAVVLLVIIFLLGVSVGRGVRTEAPGGLEAAGPPGVPGDTTVPTDPPVPPPPATGDLTYPAVLKGDPSVPPAQPPAQTAESKSVAPPAAEPTPPASAPVTPPPPPPATSAPDVKSSAAAPKPGASAKGPWVQAGAYSTQRAADAVVRDLKAKGFAAFVAANPPTFRVRLGPYATQAEAEQVSSRLLKAGVKSQVIR